VELEIIKVNVDEYGLSEDALVKIYEIVRDTRINQELEIPASPRAGIFLARLVNQYKDKFSNEYEAIRFFAPSVLSKEMRVKAEGKTPVDIVNEILDKRLH